MESSPPCFSSFLSKDITVCIKGVCTTGVLLHHLYLHAQFFAGSPVGKLFEMFGYWSVSLFFFFSGYGLMVSCQNKGDQYVSCLPSARILPLYIKYLVFSGLYMGYSIFSGRSLSIGAIGDALILKNNFILYGWYLKTILLFYILFYLSFHFSNSPKFSAGLIFGFVLLYMAICYFSHSDSATYVSCLSFLLGMYISRKNRLFSGFFQRKNLFLTLSFLITCFWILVYLSASGRALRYFAKTLSSPFFTLFALAFFFRIWQRCPSFLLNSIFRFTGTLSLEIYAIQGLFLNIFQKDISLSNPLFYSTCVIFFTLAAAPMFRKLWQFLFP